MTGERQQESDREFAHAWRARLEELADRMRRAARSSCAGRMGEGDLGELARPTGRGVGDWTFALDEGPEQVLSQWLEERAREGPLSLLTEDSGWRHRGPGPRTTGGPREVVELDGFDHGGPRLAVDPVDGTRNLMFDLRSAWSILSFAGPGAGEPRFTDLDAGLLCEIPTVGAASWRRLWAVRGAGCERARLPLEGGPAEASRALRVDSDDRPDNGYFSFFSYDPRSRPAIAAMAADFFERLEREEGAEVRSCYDDQYISSGGQLALLALGSYRLVADARTRSGRWSGRAPQTAKPYDMAGAALCALEAGAVVESLDGAPLDFPIDAHTPVDFVGYANAPTRARLAPHLWAALARADAGGARAGAPE